ncbi:MAG: hypothetical protein AAF197_03765 [Pseudomonadota bacterium]
MDGNSNAEIVIDIAVLDKRKETFAGNIRTIFWQRQRMHLSRIAFKTF